MKVAQIHDGGGNHRKRYTTINKKLTSNVKVNAQYYIDNILKPYSKREIPRIYPNGEENVTLHHDKATNHVAKPTT